MFDHVTLIYPDAVRFLAFMLVVIAWTIRTGIKEDARP
jgi:hypothetical protein